MYIFSIYQELCQAPAIISNVIQQLRGFSKIIISNCLMISLNSSASKGLTLKRTKQAFHQSTAPFSSLTKSNINTSPLEDNELRHSNSIPVQDRRLDVDSEVFGKIDINNLPHHDNEDMQAFNQLDKIISQQRSNSGDGNRLIKNRTHSYVHYAQQPNRQLRYDLSQQEFPPKIVRQTYDAKQASSGGRDVQYHFGNLEQCGLMYFSIDSTLILIKTSNFLQSQQSEQPIVMELSKHVLYVKQLLMGDLKIEDIQRHPFGQKSIILILSLQWELQFFSYEPRELVKIKDLNMRFCTSCQAVFLLDYCRRGNLYYLTESGQTGRVQLFYQNRVRLLNVGRKFALKQHFFKFTHNTKRKHDRVANLVSLETLRQLYRDLKYYWCEKKIKGLSIICDRDRNYLITLVQTSVKSQYNLNRVESPSHREIRIYNISEQNSMGLFDRIQSYYYGHPPRLLLQITEQKLYQEIGVHLFENLSLQKFKISGIHVPKPASTGPNETNLIVILANGSRLCLYASETKLILNELINMPNLEDIFKKEETDHNPTQIITQKQPTGLRILQHHFHADGSFAVWALHRKCIMNLLFSQCMAMDADKEEVIVLFKESANLGQDTNIFINYTHFQVYASQEFHQNAQKRKLEDYKSMHQQYEQMQGSRDQTYSAVTPKCQIERPEIRQVTHYPYQHLYVERDKIRVVVRLRPIDILLGTIQAEINDHSTSSLSPNDSTLKSLVDRIYSQFNVLSSDSKYYKKDLIAMLIQLYSDIEGVYYLQQLAHNNEARDRNRHSKMMDNRTATSTLPYPSRTAKTGEQRAGRLSDRRMSVNRFRKYRYQDLCRSHSFLLNQFNSNSINVRSNSSCIKLIERTIMYLAYPQRAVNMPRTHQRRSDTTEWVDSSEVEDSQGQEGALIYISRILAPIWTLKIKLIDASVFCFIVEVCKKTLELLLNIEESAPVLASFPPSFKQLRRFCQTLIEYNLMLSVLSMPADVNYSQGLRKKKQQFEQSIFFSLQQRKDFSAAVNDWRQKFPNYFNLRLWKAVKLQAEIAQIPRRDDRKEVVMRNSSSIPHYLLYYFCQDGTLTNQQFSSLLSANMSSAECSNLKNANHLLITDKMDAEGKVEYAIGEVKKTTVKLAEKQFLIGYALQNMGNIRTLDSMQMEKKKKELEQLQQVIKIQQMISKQLQIYEKQNPSELISDKTKQLINYVILNPSQLRTLVTQLKNPMISIIYYCCFWNASQNVEQILRQLSLDSHQKMVGSVKIREKLIQLFEIFSKNITTRLPLSPLLSMLDSICYQQIKLQDLTYFLTSSDDSQIQKIFWVPSFVGEQGWSQLMILDHYTEQSRNHYLNCQIRTQKKFMYYWFSAYAFVKSVYIGGRRAFQIFNEQISRIYSNPRESTSALTHFLKQSLKY